MSRLRMRSFVKIASFLAAFSLLLNFVAVPKVAGQKQDGTSLRRLSKTRPKSSTFPSICLLQSHMRKRILTTTMENPAQTTATA